MWGIVESYNNLTPRGLEDPISGSEEVEMKEILDSFLLPQNNERKKESERTFEYMIFVWNGKSSNPLVKSQALSNAFELENVISKGGEKLLQIFFSGGVIRNKKLQKGKIISLSSTSNKSPNKCNCLFLTQSVGKWDLKHKFHHFPV